MVSDLDPQLCGPATSMQNQMRCRLRILVTMNSDQGYLGLIVQINVTVLLRLSCQFPQYESQLAKAVLQESRIRLMT